MTSHSCQRPAIRRRRTRLLGWDERVDDASDVGGGVLGNEGHRRVEAQWIRSRPGRGCARAKCRLGVGGDELSWIWGTAGETGDNATLTGSFSAPIGAGSTATLSHTPSLSVSITSGMLGRLCT